MQNNIDLIIGDWLDRRKITHSVQSDFNIHSGFHPTLGDCIVIPITNFDGSFSFNKYRRMPTKDTGPKYIYDKGGKLALFGAYEATDSNSVLVTEGEMDTLVAWSHNIPAVSSTGGALSISEDWKQFFNDKDVIVCFDNDPAGGEGMAKFIDIIPHAKVLLLPDMANVKDISDYVAHGGDLSELLKAARHYQDLSDVKADRAERLAMFRGVHFHDAYIKRHEEKKSSPLGTQKRSNAGDEITRAKSFPIPEMLTFNSSGNARCVFHAEKTASMHYYAEDNHVYCFGCGKIGDSIDVYKQLNNVGFKDAIKALQ
jgi:DNA primase